MSTLTHGPKLPSPPNGAFDLRAFLWKVLDRYDLYIGTTISRAATATALNTLLVGYVMLKAGDILGAFGSHTKLKWVAFAALVVGGVAAFASMFLSFLAVAPYLGRSGSHKNSLIFFEHVAGYERGDFVARTSALDEHEATRDLAEQVHDVATGLSGKFKWLRHASWTTLAALGAVLILGACAMISTFIDWVK
jgi:hypothetical protein